MLDVETKPKTIDLGQKGTFGELDALGCICCLERLWIKTEPASRIG